MVMATNIDGDGNRRDKTAYQTVGCEYGRPWVMAACMYMLSNAAAVDDEVARALANCDGGGKISVAKALLKLREKAISFAADADADTKRHPSVAFQWWEAVEGVDTMFSSVMDALMKLETLYDDGDPDDPDTELAAAFFDLAAPRLVASAASPLARERETALQSLGKCAVAVARPKALALLVKSKTTWERLVAATAGDYDGDEDVSGARPAPASEEGLARQSRASRTAAASAVGVMGRLCGRGMTVDHSPMRGTPVIPGPLAVQMIKRGVIPVLMANAKSPLKTVSREAMQGLGQISRVKDCRAIMLQEKGVETCRDTLWSDDPHVASSAMLLITHLLWDEEWRAPLADMKPPMQEAAVKWGAYAALSLVKLADEKRKQALKRRDKLTSDMLSAVRLRSSMNPAELRVYELEQEQKKREFSAKMANIAHHYELETAENGTWRSTMLNRCVLMMGTMLHDPDAPRRLLDAGGLGLVEACIDVPIEDTYSAAANFIGNLSAVDGDYVKAENFKDPKHVIESILRNMNNEIHVASATGNMRAGPNKSGMILMRAVGILREKDSWSKYFDEVMAEAEPGTKELLKLSARFGGGPPPARGSGGGSGGGGGGGGGATASRDVGATPLLRGCIRTLTTTASTLRWVL